jgi:hypothetical protein
VPLPVTGRVSREAILEALSRALPAHDFIRAAWFGGSDATGRTDAWSDVDLQLLVDDDRVEDAFAAVHAALGALSPVELVYRFPAPTWHGHDQEFFRLRDADPCHFMDLLVIRLGSADRCLEVERHGRAQVLFDRGGFTRPPALDRDALAARRAKRLEAIRVLFPLLQNLVTKAVRRGHAADAAASYLAYTFRPLVDLARIRYCPDRFDFGPRYLDRDLPATLAREIDRLALPGSLEQVEAYRARCEALFLEHLAALESTPPL